jgi:hypothetical protein
MTGHGWIRVKCGRCKKVFECKYPENTSNGNSCTMQNLEPERRICYCDKCTLGFSPHPESYLCIIRESQEKIEFT